MRVDSVVVSLVVYEEFEGSREIKFAWKPGAGDELVRALLAKNEQLNTQDVAAKGPGDIFIG
jgi:hypothetical protein